MKYLEGLIIEQINRVDSLKKRLEKPLQYAELAVLKDRINNILDEQGIKLSKLLMEIQVGEQTSSNETLRRTRSIVRQITEVETYGIAALEYQNKESEFLNKLTFKIHQEIDFPLTSPSVCCISTNYYFTVPFANIIFVPLLESEYLLHLSDLYHEIGHLVVREREKSPTLNAIKDSFDQAFTKITEYYVELINEKTRERSPEEIPHTIRYIHEQWKSWLVEFFCDLFAAYTLGPAYVWSHLHLSTKTSPDIYQISIVLDQSHPADEARMKMLLYGLQNTKFYKELDVITSEWKKLKNFWSEPSPEYQYAYPDELLKEITEIFLKGMQESGFNIMTPEKMKQEKDTVRITLNESWDKFWECTVEEFRQWEIEHIKYLKNDVLTVK